MAKVTYDKEITALLVIDPYNDFISEGGKLWGRLKTVAEANNCVPHMLQVLNAVREAEIRVFYALHHRYRPGDYETWKYIAPIQKAGWLQRLRKRHLGWRNPQGVRASTGRNRGPGALVFQWLRSVAHLHEPELQFHHSEHVLDLERTRDLVRFFARSTSSTWFLYRQRRWVQSRARGAHC